MAEQAVFVWAGSDRHGRAVDGELAGPTPQVVRALLRRQGITAKRVRKKRRRGGSRIGQRIRTADIALFSRQMATMMRAGVPLVQAFDIVASGVSNAKLAAVIGALRDEVAAGTPLSSALAGFAVQFDDMYRNLVHVGEQSGALDTMLDRIAAYQEGAEATKRKLKKAMTYPLLVVVAALVVTAILLIHVVPQFEAVFAGVGSELPAFTQFVIGLSDFMQAWWWALLGVMIIAGTGFAALRRRSQRFRDTLDRLFLKVPVAGRIIVKAAVARCARTLATAVSAGVPLVDALGSVADATGNAVYVDAVRSVRDDVAAGQPLHGSLRTSGVFPDMMVQMVAVGEESGSLDDMLGKTAEHFEGQVNDAVDNLAALVEPLLMAVLGVLVGGLILAMYLPVFQLGAVFGQ